MFVRHFCHYFHFNAHNGKASFFILLQLTGWVVVTSLIWPIYIQISKQIPCILSTHVNTTFVRTKFLLVFIFCNAVRVALKFVKSTKHECRKPCCKPFSFHLFGQTLDWLSDTNDLFLSWTIWSFEENKVTSSLTPSLNVQTYKRKMDLVRWLMR